MMTTSLTGFIDNEQASDKLSSKGNDLIDANPSGQLIRNYVSRLLQCGGRRVEN